MKSAEQRIVLARVAAAVAARFYSTVDGVHLIVDEPHVQWAHDFLERCWCKASMGYDQYSKMQKNTDKVHKSVMKVEK